MKDYKLFWENLPATFAEAQECMLELAKLHGLEGSENINSGYETALSELFAFSFTVHNAFEEARKTTEVTFHPVSEEIH